MIFTYWEGKKHGFIDLCHQTLAKHNDDFKVLTPEDIEKEPSMEPFLADPYYKILMPAHRADIIRIKLLEEYGGVWIDSDFIAMQSFDTLIEASNRKHALYYYRDSWQATNGILIAPPKHSMIVEWSRKIDCVYSNLKRLHTVPTTSKGWCTFGADQLKVCIENAIDNHQDLGWDRVQLIPYEELHKYFFKAPQHILRDYAWPGCYGYMLFNTGFPDWFKQEKAEDILKGDWLISLLFRISLGLEKF